MTENKQALSKGALWIVGLVVLRLIFSFTLGDKVDVFARPRPAAFLLPSGSVDSPAPDTLQEPDTTTEPTQPPTEPSTEPTKPVADIPGEGLDLESADVSFVEVEYPSAKKADTEALLTQPLNWDLTGEEPAVLIFHTHGTEAYTPTDGSSYQEEGGEFRTTNNSYNMISIGEELSRLLNEAGIHTVHDTAFYDYPDYPSAYDTARVGLQKQLQKYPTVKLVIDLHRDAAEWEDGTQWATEATVNGEKSAQVMLVMGTDTYYTHPNWEQNLSVALKLHAAMEKNHPGVTRPLDVRRQRFNQDLSTGAVIAEVGAAGNTHEEAMNAISVLAEAIIRMAKGTV